MQELSSKILTGYNGVVKYFICVKCNKKKTFPEKHIFSKWKDIIKYQCDECYAKKIKTTNK